jgi:pyruvate,orthophosphate dikinase
MGRCCVAGCGELVVDEHKQTLTVGGKTYTSSDIISIDGSTGFVYGTKVPTTDATVSGDFGILMGWVDAARHIKVRTNADTPKDAQQAVIFGAEGIGLCRTEHMFFGEDRIPAMREMIVSKTVEDRKKALAKLLPMQREDFIGLYEAMQGRPVTIRFLDPPLHEFLPTKDSDIAALAKEMKMTADDLTAFISTLHEMNPMLGHRGVRLSITYPEIAEMQTRAVIEAPLPLVRRALRLYPK